MKKKRTITTLSFFLLFLPSIIMILLFLFLPLPTMTALRSFLAGSKYTFIADLAEQHPVIVCLVIGASGIVGFALDAILLFLFYKLVTVVSSWIKPKKKEGV